MHVDPVRALWVVVAVLVVSCPCALSLATPAAMTVAVGSLARRGVVAVRAHAIDALAAVTHVVFDKTGTLTEGRLGLAGVQPRPGVEPGAALALAAALERTSEHPIALALTVAAPAAIRATASAVRNVPGAGIEGYVDGVRYRLGTSLFVAEIAGTPADTALPAAGATRVWLGGDGQWLACFDLVDRLRPEAAAMVRQLHAQGKRVLIWSGDAAGAVEAVARQLGVDGYEAGLLPQDKQARMQAMQRDGAVVAMVGDGVNDAPVLAQAQLAVAMGSGALLSQTQADMVLLSGRLQGLIDAFTLAARTRRIVRQNLIWAAAYNLAALPLAAAGHGHPMDGRPRHGDKLARSGAQFASRGPPPADPGQGADPHGSRGTRGHHSYRIARVVVMDIVYLLIPLSVVLAFLIGAVFWWSLQSGQFDDLEGPAHRILQDDDGPPERR